MSGRAVRRSLALLLVSACGWLALAPDATPARQPVPTLAYYYIWFKPSSWNRAKRDYPLLGRYSSDERTVMRQHVRWAKEAGIDGFIVSWKSTKELDGRLSRLIEVASEENFKLALIYQGLDFEREPLPAARVANDLDIFIDRFAGSAPFSLFGKPLVIWSGTWRFTADEISRVTAPRRDRLTILASEKSVKGYQRVADAVDGDAYYWSSVDPRSYPAYFVKLQKMAAEVHARGGRWIAPAAPGFDGRMIGGASVVPRRDGETLRQRLSGALRSSPDAIGLISWNEFSENTHVEPSERWGARYLDILADVRGAEFKLDADFDSSEPAATDVRYGRPLLFGFVVLLAAAVVTGIGRAWRRAFHRNGQPATRLPKAQGGESD